MSSRFQKGRQAPPVVEIQPMMSSKSSHGKGPAPAPPDTPAGQNPSLTTGQLSPASPRVPATEDAWLGDKIAGETNNTIEGTTTGEK